MTQRARAKTVDELHGKMMSMFSAADSSNAPYEPRETDVIISPFAKCGTTWLQQIFHTLRTRGDTVYDDVSRVVPWIETAPMLGIDLNAEQKADPRGFKSHLSYTDIPKGARYIVSIRDPRDALVSMYRFMEGWFMEPGAVSLEDFARGNFMRGDRKQYWSHLASWLEQRENANVLLLCYESMVRDPEATIRRVAAFCGIELDDELLDITLRHSSMAYMLEKKHQFDDLMMRELSERVADLPPGSDSAKVREGKVGGHASILSDGITAELDEIWRADIEPRFGVRAYSDIEGVLHVET